jgi:hypothetical protein
MHLSHDNCILLRISSNPRLNAQPVSKVYLYCPASSSVNPELALITRNPESRPIFFSRHDRNFCGGLCLHSHLYTPFALYCASQRSILCHCFNKFGHNIPHAARDRALANRRGSVLDLLFPPLSMARSACSSTPSITLEGRTVQACRLCPGRDDRRRVVHSRLVQGRRL